MLWGHANRFDYEKMSTFSLFMVFPRPFTHGGDKALMGGSHEGDLDLMGGPNFDRLYRKLKVLLLLSCNCTMQFVGYDSIKTC